PHGDAEDGHQVHPQKQAQLHPPESPPPQQDTGGDHSQEWQYDGRQDDQLLPPGQAIFMQVGNRGRRRLRGGGGGRGSLGGSGGSDRDQQITIRLSGRGRRQSGISGKGPGADGSTVSRRVQGRG